MIKSNQRGLNITHIIVDALIIVISYALSYFIMFGGVFTDKLPALPPEVYGTALAFILPGALLLYWIFNLYSPKRIQSIRFEIANIIKANAVSLLIVTMILYLAKDKLIGFSRPMVFIFFGLNVFLEILFRGVVRKILKSLRTHGYNQKHVLLIGYSRAAQSYIDRVVANPSWGYRIRGILDDTQPRGVEYKGVKVLAKTENLAEILDFNRLDEIAITLGLGEYDKLASIVAACEKSGVHTKFIPDYDNVIPTKPYTEDLLGLPIVHIRNVPLNDPLNASTKRFFDIIGAILAIIIFSPVMLAAAISVKLSSKGPVIYKQERIGKHNRPFNMYKFRSMRVQKEEEEKKCWTTADDPRVTEVGKFIRKTSVDELPQLFNVLKGDMSLIGPRPERPQFVEQFKEEIPRYMVKHQVRPGMTGWAQVNGFRGDTSITERINCDLYYIENWSLGLDLKILFLTVFKGFVNKNAY
ncbi:MAG: undecaprenyl-phosphate glucose phosphotransferase [Lachnospiraceae bacterium]|nr:undecaprenyl-phosphate glucose phosphotransferase [Lachnospiraceae bacterium]